MTVTITNTYTKPADVDYFADVNPTNFATMQEYNIWLKSLPSFVSKNVTKSNSTTKVETIIWETVGNYSNFLLLRDTRPELSLIIDYNSNKITVHSIESIS
jgi:hypothetical protein